jgi:hypothetical protein
VHGTIVCSDDQGHPSSQKLKPRRLQPVFERMTGRKDRMSLASVRRSTGANGRHCTHTRRRTLHNHAMIKNRRKKRAQSFTSSQVTRLQNWLDFSRYLFDSQGTCLFIIAPDAVHLVQIVQQAFKGPSSHRPTTASSKATDPVTLERCNIFHPRRRPLQAVDGFLYGVQQAATASARTGPCTHSS